MLMEQKIFTLDILFHKILDLMDTLTTIVEATYMTGKVPLGTHFILEHVWYHRHKGNNPE